MIKKQHSHAKRQLNRRPLQTSQRLPKKQFGGLVGELDHITLSPHNGPRPDDNHIYIWLRVPGGPVAGRYECAFNTESSSYGAECQFYEHEEQIEMGDFPSFGFWQAGVSYAGLGLSQELFNPIENGQLRSAVRGWLADASLVVAYGFTYSGGDGLHDIHMNSGERSGSTHPNKPNEDGALLMYYRDERQNPYRRWVFIKFDTQDL